MRSLKVPALPSRSVRLVPLVLALAVSHAYGAEIVGQAGTPGVKGATPGAPGTNGGNGGDAIANVAGGAGIDVYGGAGGHGGDGANGISGQNGGPGGSGGNGGNAISTTIAPAGAWDAVIARGGAGGSAGRPGWYWPWEVTGPGSRGRGGDATITWESTGGATTAVTTRAYGGDAGSGNATDTGAFGGAARTVVTANATDSTIIEAGARGGNGASISSATTNGIGSGVAGGTATLELAASAADVSLTATAWGGDGGKAGGAGNTGGNGATASAQLTGSAGRTLATRVSLQGGAGGAGQLGANGGNGADVSFGLPFNAANTTGALDIEGFVRGGNGGASDVAAAGRAGAASTALVLDARKAASVRVSVDTIGGRGGDVDGWRVDTSNGKTTAGAAASSDLQLTAGGALDIRLSAQGGDGGSIGWLGDNGGSGARGGDGAATFVGTTDTALASEVSVAGTGGTGGRSRSAGLAGGAGGTGRASATLYNTGSGDLTVNVYATGGSGGEGGVGADGDLGADGGQGADAILDNAVRAGTGGKLVLLQDARAGAGGQAINGGVHGVGGAAVSRLALRDSRSTDLAATVRAIGGDGIRGGRAEAVLELESTVAGAAVNGAAAATGGAGFDIGRSGGNALARSTAIARGAATSTASAISHEWTRNGDVDAFARAAGGTTAQATATALTGRTPELVARSRAEAESGAGSASALSSSTGGLANSHASARVTGDTVAAPGQAWLASAQSVAAGANKVQVTTTASAPGQGDTYARTGANVGGTIDGPALQGGSGASSFATGAPDATALATFLAGAPEVAAGVSDATVLGAGIMEAASSAATGTYSYVTAMNFQFDTRGPGQLTFGLVGASATGDALRELVLSVSNHGTEVFSRTFTSQGEALEFFSDQALLLGTFAAGSQDILVSADYTFEGAGAFSYGYAMALAVPEPQTWMLMLLGLSVVLLRRKAKM